MESLEFSHFSESASLADELENLQADKNEGRGVTVVRSIAGLLRSGNIQEAKALASHDHDKIRNYPDIENVLRQKLFDGEDVYRWMP